MDRLRERLKNRRGTEEPPAFSRSLFDEPESGPHGPITREFYHNPRGAIAWLLAKQTGDAVGALYHPHPRLGYVDLIWGKAGTEARYYDDGEGIAKLVAKSRVSFLPAHEGR